MSARRQLGIAREILGEALTGAQLGLCCTLTMLLIDVDGVREHLSRAAHGILDFAALACVVSAIFAVGMAITGFVLIKSEREGKHPGRR